MTEKTLAEQKAEELFSFLNEISSSNSQVGRMKDSRRQYNTSGLNPYNKTMTRDKINNYLSNPLLYSKELVYFSDVLYQTSPTYNKIINFYATLPTYAYVVEASTYLGNHKEEAREQYIQTLEQLEKMSLRHELQKIMKIAYKHDVFYGFEVETKNSYFIKPMPHEYCRLSTTSDGVFNYEFDFSYFHGVSEEVLHTQPKYFQDMYNFLLKRNEETGEDFWMELDPKRAFAIKINEDIPFPLPPFATSMESALEEELYNEIKRDKEALDNFITLIQQIPLNDDDQSLDVFRINLQMARNFHNEAVSTLPEGVGLITSPMPITAVKLEKSKRDDDLGMKAKDNTLSNAGLPPNIFSTTNKTSGGIKYAIQYLEQYSFAPLRQIERWINRKLKFMNKDIRFQIRLLDITNYSRDEVFERNLKGAQFGLPTRQEAVASLGLSPLDFENKLIIENDYLELPERMTPLTSSHTQKAGENSSGEQGRKKLDDREVKESTETWRQNQ